MCHDPDSDPPIEPGAASIEHERLVLETADGTRLRAFAARPKRPARTGVVVLPDVRGLHRFYETLCLRLAERGYAAVAIDYFGRTAGTDERDDDYPHMDHVGRTTLSGLESDVAAGVAWLRSPTGPGARAVFTLGFCFGGRLSWLAAAGGHGLAGAIGFYGRPGPFQDGKPGPIQRASELDAPILALMAGDDAGIPQEDVDAWKRALEEAGVEHEVVTYSGAPHSFFDRKCEEFTEASQDAWRRLLEFLDRWGAPAAA
jgi:carboxymethylenebutenolidase